MYTDLPCDALYSGTTLVGCGFRAAGQSKCTGTVPAPYRHCTGTVPALYMYMHHLSRTPYSDVSHLQWYFNYFGKTKSLRSKPIVLTYLNGHRPCNCTYSIKLMTLFLFLFIVSTILFFVHACVITDPFHRQIEVAIFSYVLTHWHNCAPVWPAPGTSKYSTRCIPLRAARTRATPVLYCIQMYMCASVFSAYNNLFALYSALNSKFICQL